MSDNRNWALAESGCRLIDDDEGNEDVLTDGEGCWSGNVGDVVTLQLAERGEDEVLRYVGWATKRATKSPAVVVASSGATKQRMTKLVKMQARPGRGMQIWLIPGGLPSRHAFVSFRVDEAFVSSKNAPPDQAAAAGASPPASPSRCTSTANPEAAAEIAHFFLFQSPPDVPESARNPPSAPGTHSSVRSSSLQPHGGGGLAVSIKSPTTPLSLTHDAVFPPQDGRSPSGAARARNVRKNSEETAPGSPPQPARTPVVKKPSAVPGQALGFSPTASSPVLPSTGTSPVSMPAGHAVNQTASPPQHQGGGGVTAYSSIERERYVSASSIAASALHRQASQSNFATYKSLGGTHRRTSNAGHSSRRASPARSVGRTSPGAGGGRVTPLQAAIEGLANDVFKLRGIRGNSPTPTVKDGDRDRPLEPSASSVLLQNQAHEAEQIGGLRSAVDFLRGDIQTVHQLLAQNQREKDSERQQQKQSVDPDRSPRGERSPEINPRLAAIEARLGSLEAVINTMQASQSRHQHALDDQFATMASSIEEAVVRKVLTRVENAVESMAQRMLAEHPGPPSDAGRDSEARGKKKTTTTTTTTTLHSELLPGYALLDRAHRVLNLDQSDPIDGPHRSERRHVREETVPDSHYRYAPRTNVDVSHEPPETKTTIHPRASPIGAEADPDGSGLAALLAHHQRQVITLHGILEQDGDTPPLLGPIFPSATPAPASAIRQTYPVNFSPPLVTTTTTYSDQPNASAFLRPQSTHLVSTPVHKHQSSRY
ncbi:hypothetical protein DIPPA_18800 [Diplonema papillatum]|nr:hypothetical protein DIPPA_18800 [Diplonema papillatum]